MSLFNTILLKITTIKANHILLYFALGRPVKIRIFVYFGTQQSQKTVPYNAI